MRVNYKSIFVWLIDYTFIALSKIAWISFTNIHVYKKKGYQSAVMWKQHAEL